MIIDTENLNTLSLPEIALLLLLYDSKLDKSKTVLEVKDTDIEGLLERLSNKGYITSTIYATDFTHKPPYQHIVYSLVQKGKQALADNCIQDKSMLKIASNKAIASRCNALALKLMELYPQGNKPGTSLKWKGSQKGVAEKLQKVIQEGCEFTDEEAIEATKAYIASFNGIYTRMRILPYFIRKNELVGGEVEKRRDFVSYVEDIQRNPQQTSLKQDWDVELK